MFIYVEFFSRRAGASLENFHRVVDSSVRGWSEDHAQDRCLLNVGRTFRVGPDPHYVTVWGTSATDTSPLGDWEKVFASGQGDRHQAPYDSVARIDRAGCYLTHRPVELGTEGPFLIEHFERRVGATPEDVEDYYGDGRPGGRPAALFHRIRNLAPSAGLAVWELGGYGDLMTAGTPDDEAAPVVLSDTGIYVPFGHEIL